MSLTINSKNNISSIKTTENKAKITNNTTQQVLMTKKTQISSEKQEAANNLKCRILQLLDWDKNYYEIRFAKSEEGIMYLKFTRPENSERDPKLRRKFCNGTIKSKLGIKDGVLKKYNDLKDVTGRPTLDESADATIEPGKSLFIPLSELGQNYNWNDFGKKDLKDYIQKFENAE